MHELPERNNRWEHRPATLSSATEVSENFHKERKIPFYVQRIVVSVGHLHNAIKHVSGKSPGDWIEQFVAKEACALLKGTSLTIQQIGFELSFPSQSFFGKFFKRVV